jgi:hypothetical protein
MRIKIVRLRDILAHPELSLSPEDYVVTIQKKGDRVMLYSENGDHYMGDSYTAKEAKQLLKNLRYTKAYTGRKFSRSGDKVLIGINEFNTIDLPLRRKNGLWHGKEINLN